ncbi:MAG: response regulator [Planctomycetota bacterium]
MRPPIPPADPDAGFKPQPGGRFNILLTEDRARPVEHWTRQFPRLMRPLGVEAHLATTGRQALELAERITFHAAFVDLATPKDVAARAHPAGASPNGGLWLLEVLQRRTQRPPVVVVNSRATRQQAVRLLNEALRLGAFSVVNRPEDLHPLLTVIQRLLNRHHQGQWPTPAPGNAPGTQDPNPADHPSQ